MDIQSILNNQNVKDILNKVGVSEDKQEKVIDQAVDLLKSKALSDPQAITSLFSSQPNTATDKAFQSGLQNDFLKNLVSKVGLPAELAEKVSNSLPDLLKNFSGGKGFDLGSLTGMLDAFSGNSSGKEKKGSSGGLGGLIANFFKK